MKGVEVGRRFWVFYNDAGEYKALRVIDDHVDRTIQLKDLFEVTTENTVYEETIIRRVYLYFKTDWHTETDMFGKPFLTDLREVELVFDNTPDEDILKDYESWDEFINQFRELVQ